MKGLASSDIENQNRAMEAADKFLSGNQLLGGKPGKENGDGVKMGFDETSMNTV